MTLEKVTYNSNSYTSSGGVIIRRNEISLNKIALYSFYNHNGIRIHMTQNENSNPMFRILCLDIESLNEGSCSFGFDGYYNTYLYDLSLYFGNFSNIYGETMDNYITGFFHNYAGVNMTIDYTEHKFSDEFSTDGRSITIKRETLPTGGKLYITLKERL